MTQEEKDLVLRDLCARLPYGVKVKCPFDNEPYTLLSINWDKEIVVIGVMNVDTYATSKEKLVKIKPYLRPMSSMTKEEKKELVNYVLGGKGAEFFHVTEDGSIDGNQEAEQDLFKMKLHWINFSPETASCYLEWLYEKQFDVNGLIPLDLAIEVTESNNPYKD